MAYYPLYKTFEKGFFSSKTLILGIFWEFYFPKNSHTPTTNKRICHGTMANRVKISSANNWQGCSGLI